MSALSANLRSLQEKRYTGRMATGLRERKKRETRDALTRTALGLFAERGYDETTLADIAEAAGVSTRTIFAYFPSKEDILFCTMAQMSGSLAEALATRPAGTDALTTLRDFIVASADRKTELDRRVSQVIAADATLASHQRAPIAGLRDLLAAAIAEVLGPGATTCARRSPRRRSPLRSRPSSARSA